jgi:hypothetical protein
VEVSKAKKDREEIRKRDRTRDSTFGRGSQHSRLWAKANIREAQEAQETYLQRELVDFLLAQEV